MAGIFGAIRTGPAGPRQDLAQLGREMSRRLSLARGHAIEMRAQRGAVLGRYGAPFHHGTPWSDHPSTAVIAGLIGFGSAEPVGAEGLRPGALRQPFAAAFKGPGGWTLAVDRTASIPVYYARVPGLLVFASQVKALLAHPALDRAADEQAMAMFLSCGHLAGDQTLFGSVRRLRGGHTLTLGEQGSITIERYWRFLPGSRAGEHGPAELERRLAEALAAATARAIADPDRTLLLLSGGIDSRALLGAALEAFPARRIQAVTFAGEGGDNSDLACARAVARAAGIRHRAVQRRIGDHGAEFAEMNAAIDGLSTVAVYTPNSYGQYRSLAESGIDTVLRGDEATSYGRHVDSLSDALKLVSIRAVDEVAGLPHLLRAERREAMIAASRGLLSDIAAEARGLRPPQARDAIGFEHHLQTFLASSASYKSVFLAHRAPLLDYDLLDLMECVPDEERADKQLFLRAMSARYPRLFRLGFAKRWSTLEDWAAMLAGPSSARSFILDLLADRDSAFWDLIDHGAAVNLLTRIDADARQPGGRLRHRCRIMLRQLSAMAARPLSGALKGRVKARQPYRPRPHVLMLRLIALKDWHDRLRTAPAAAALRVVDERVAFPLETALAP